MNTRILMIIAATAALFACSAEAAVTMTTGKTTLYRSTSKVAEYATQEQCKAAALANAKKYESTKTSGTTAYNCRTALTATYSANVPVNNAPTISGSPPSAKAGVPYGWTPTASDADGDPLSYSIQNPASWMAFSSATGRITGTPQASHVGTVSNISITVSDGKGSASLALGSFTTLPPDPVVGSVALSWVPPTQNTDGSALTNLAGYRILFGTSPTALTQVLSVSNPFIATYVVDALPLGRTYYFALKSFNATGAESALSNVVSKSL